MGRRKYKRVCGDYWTGTTGKIIRQAGRDAQVVGAYLMTCHSAHDLGLYYLPIPIMCHELGISEQGASKALRRLSEGGFCHYDPPSETVLVVEMAAYQLDEVLTPKDNRHKWVLDELEQLRKSPLFSMWCARYRVPFQLPDLADIIQAPSEPLQSPSEGSPKPNSYSYPYPYPKEEKKPPVSPLPKRATRCPVEFALTPQRLAWAVAAGLAEELARREFAVMQDYEFRSPHADWEATWRNWVRRSLTLGGPNGNRPHGNRPHGSEPAAPGTPAATGNQTDRYASTREHIRRQDERRGAAAAASAPPKPTG